MRGQNINVLSSMDNYPNYPPFRGTLCKNVATHGSARNGIPELSTLPWTYLWTTWGWNIVASHWVPTANGSRQLSTHVNTCHPTKPRRWAPTATLWRQHLDSRQHIFPPSRGGGLPPPVRVTRGSVPRWDTLDTPLLQTKPLRRWRPPPHPLHQTSQSRPRRSHRLPRHPPVASRFSRIAVVKI